MMIEIKSSKRPGHTKGCNAKEEEEEEEGLYKTAQNRQLQYTRGYPKVSGLTA
jgi:hypothetical protein